MLHCFVREADNEKFTSTEDDRSGCVGGLAIFVNRSIDFDDQSRLIAEEVGDEAINDLLTAKLVSVETTRPQSFPEKRLAWCVVVSKFSRPCELALLNTLAADNSSKWPLINRHRILPPEKMQNAPIRLRAP